MKPVQRRSPRPWGIAISAVLLHILNLLTFTFVRWGERDVILFAPIFASYICFTAIVIHAYWRGESWARWIILIRSVPELASYKLLGLMGGFQLVQGVSERVLAVGLLLYLNLAGVRAWFRR